MRNGFQTLLQIVQNDFGYDLNFALQDSAGAALDISSATLEFVAQLDSDRTIEFSNAMVVVDASNGKCKYTVQATDFVIAGTWTAQVRVTYISGEVISFTGITLQVDSELPIS